MLTAYVLDACALIAHLRKETGWEKVHHLLDLAIEETVTLLMHNATLAEVYYDTIYISSVNDADSFLHDLAGLPVKCISTVSPNFIKSIGFYKTQYKVSFADCFVLPTAEIYDATIITSDRHEFGAIEKDKRLRFEWIR